MKIKRILVEFELDSTDEQNHSSWAQFIDGLWHGENDKGFYPRVATALQKIWVAARGIVE